MEIINNQQKDLPNATAILVLGILSLIFCWCYGFFGLVLGIIAVVLSGSQRRLYQACPSEYTESSFRNVNSGRTCAIVAICISGLIMMAGILCVLGIFAVTILPRIHF